MKDNEKTMKKKASVSNYPVLPIIRVIGNNYFSISETQCPGIEQRERYNPQCLTRTFKMEWKTESL
jgi:hypothetical protein